MKLLPPQLFLLTIALMAASHLWLPSPFQLATGWRAAGLVLALAGLTVTIAASRQFSARHTNINTFNDPTRLVTDGLFRLSRNPMYAGFTAALYGVALMFGSLTPLLLATAFAIISDRWYIRFEERAMRAKFGTAYTEYAQTTRRWI